MQEDNMSTTEGRQVVRRTIRTFRFVMNSRKTILGFVVLTTLVLVAIFAPFISSYDPNSMRFDDAFKPPSFISGDIKYLLGTDSLGRDIYSRVIYGSRPALFVAVVGSFFAALIGSSLGIFAGYYSGKFGELVMRIVDIWMSIPAVVFAIALIAVLGVDIVNVTIAIILIDWTRFARVVRGEVLNIMEKDFVSAAKITGLKDFSIILSEVVPNLIPLMTILFTLEMSIAITVEVLLSFTGLGVSPSMPSWGSMIAEGLSYFRVNPWGVLIPLISVILVIMSINSLGDGLREKLDPRLSVRR